MVVEKKTDLQAQVSLLYFLFGKQLFGFTKKHELPGFQHGAMAGDAQATAAFYSTKIRATSKGAIPNEGPSRISNLGRDINARLITSICCSPPA